MKNVFLYAYDCQNLGDDLFTHTITKRYPDTQFYIWSTRENRKTFQSLPNLKVLDNDSTLVRILNGLRASFVPRYKGWLENRCDAVVYIGGSIFMEYPNWEQIATWWEYEAENRPFYVIGANFGPYHTEAYKAKMEEIFGKMQDVCFRDLYSYNLFRNTEHVRYAPDILLSCSLPCVPIKEKQIFVSIINCADRDESHALARYDVHYTENMAKLLREYLNNGYRLVLSSFCREEGDETGVAKVLQAMGKREDERIKILNYDGSNSNELIAAIAESELVIATRFHATILALAAGRPVIPIVYSDKTLHILQDLGFSDSVFDIRCEEDWDIPKQQPRWKLPDAIRKEAENHFQMLDKVLN